ncbi:MAG TPA: transglycosylase SLT domain-containing protein [Pyrinomonadaceae bacterium]|nr:transglycosylase SLT domain-containing protein [Pyrinomonadaceae bacterium]
MTSNVPRLNLRALLAVAALCFPAIIQAQIPSGSSAREIPNEIQKAEPQVEQIIERANDHFRRGKLNLEDNKREQARDEFDKAVDAILQSGLDVRANQRLQTFYLELVEKIYREEVPVIQQTQQNIIPVVAQGAPNPRVEKVEVAQAQAPKQPQIGFRQQGFEPSPLDPLSKLILTEEEKQVSGEQLATLEEAKNALDFKFTINPLIQQFINYYQGRGRRDMESGLRRSGRFMKMAREVFRQEGVPEDLAWLGQIESGWNTKAYSSAAASGLWQFVPATGRTYGLRQTAWIDERNSIEQATHASARLLKALGKHYNGNWELALAAYNNGSIDRAIAHAGVANFWSIYPFIVQQTRDYVPNILATILIAKNPEKYGFHGIRPEAPWTYERYEIAGATSLKLIADATDTSVDVIQTLNPELRRDTTPRGEPYMVRVPAGKSKQLASVLKRIPSERRDSVRIVSVAPGEELQSVANRTGVNVATLQAMNAGIDLKSANKLVVPGGSVRLTNWRRAAAPADTTTAASLTRVRARKGDTIASIAAAHKLSVDELARLNGIAPNVELQAGQEIRLPGTSASSTPAPSNSRRR